MKCPNKVLQIPSTQDFTINNYTYTGHPYEMTLTQQDQQLNFHLDMMMTKQLNPFEIKLETENYDFKEQLKSHIKASPINFFNTIMSAIVATFILRMFVMKISPLIMSAISCLRSIKKDTARPSATIVRSSAPTIEHTYDELPMVRTKSKSTFT